MTALANVLRATTQLVAMCIAAALVALLVVSSVSALQSRNESLDIAHRAQVALDRESRQHATTDMKLQREISALTRRVAQGQRTRLILARDVRALTKQLRAHGINPIVVLPHATAHKSSATKRRGKSHTRKPTSPRPSPTSSICVDAVCLAPNPNGKTPPGQIKKLRGVTHGPVL